MHLFELRVLCGYMLRSVTSLVAQVVKNPPAGNPGLILGQEDPLEKGQAYPLQ